MSKVRRDGGVRVEEERITDCCEWEPELVGDRPPRKRCLINHQGGHTGGTDDSRAGIKNRISRACTDGQGMLEGCPSLE